MNGPMTTVTPDKLSAILQRHDEIRLAMLFGSHATGTARPDSDIDVAVWADSALDAETRIALIEELALAFGRPIDLIDLRRAGEPLLGEILNGKRLFGAPDIYASLLSRHLLDVADFVPLQRRILAARRDAWLRSS